MITQSCFSWTKRFWSLRRNHNKIWRLHKRKLKRNSWVDKNGRSFAPRIGQRAAYRGNHSSYIFAFLGFFFLFVCLFFLAALQHMEFMGQGSDLSHSCDLYCSYSNARSFSPLCRPGIEPVSWYCRDRVDPVGPQWKLLHFCWSLILTSPGWARAASFRTLNTLGMTQKWLKEQALFLYLHTPSSIKTNR